jgi:hypothetical protein
MKFLIVQLPPFSRHLIPLRSKYPDEEEENYIYISKIVLRALCNNLRKLSLDNPGSACTEHGVGV